MNTTVRAARPESPPYGAGRSGVGATGPVAGVGATATTVRVTVSDPELEADVRAVLAALAIEAVAAGEPCDVEVTDGAGVGRGPGGARVVRVVADRDGVDDDKAIPLPSRTGDLVARLMAPIPSRYGGQLVVVGAVGGGGASTLAAALAVRAARSRRTLLMETDPRGTGVDLVLGIEGEPGLRVEDVRAELGGPDPDALWAAVPRPLPELGVLARSRTPAETGSPGAGDGGSRDGGSGAARSHRGAGGLVVVDAGDPAGAGLVIGEGEVVVVTRADLPGAVAADRVVREVSGAVLVVRTGRGDPLHAADVARFVGAERWYVLPELAGVRRAVGSGGLVEALDRGRGGRVRGLASVADAVLREVLAGEYA